MAPKPTRVTTVELRRAVKTIDPRARVSKVDDGHWTIRTWDNAAVERLLPSLGLRHDPVFTDLEGPHWDWITVLHVFEATPPHATKKSVEDVVDEALSTTSVSNDRRTETPVQLLPGYDKARAKARDLYDSPARKRGEFGWAGAAGRAVAITYGIPGGSDEGFGGDVRRVYKMICEELRR